MIQENLGRQLRETFDDGEQDRMQAQVNAQFQSIYRPTGKAITPDGRVFSHEKGFEGYGMPLNPSRQVRRRFERKQCR